MSKLIIMTREQKYEAFRKLRLSVRRSHKDKSLSGLCGEALFSNGVTLSVKEYDFLHKEIYKTPLEERKMKGGMYFWPSEQFAPRDRWCTKRMKKYKPS